MFQTFFSTVSKIRLRIARALWFLLASFRLEQGAKTVMVRHKNRSLALRLRILRGDLFGEDRSSMATALDIPDQTWLNYENGITMPGYILLALIEHTGVNPHWLLTGKGERYTVGRGEDRLRRDGGLLHPFSN
jgi:hypothetical protein